MDSSYFDKFVDRTSVSNSFSVKWDGLQARYPEYNNDGVLPMWIADMDFLSAPEIIDAVIERAKHGIYGYTDLAITNRFFTAASAWIKKRYHWEVDPALGVFTPGVLVSVAAAVQEFTRPGDGVIIQPPVYYPFASIIENNGRVIKKNPLLRGEDGYYTMDLEQLLALAEDPGTTAMILCNPHNPVGRVWSREELEQVAEICLKNDVLLISDEIHADFIFKGHSHFTVGRLGAEYEQNLITVFSPSKTFNLAGIGVSVSFTKNREYRDRLVKRLSLNRIAVSSTFGPLAGYTAYSRCEAYVDELVKYVEDNLDRLSRAVNSMPGLRVRKPEGTYFAWIDASGLGLPDADAVCRFVHEEAKIASDFGVWFGEEGSDFFRLNLACPKATLEEAVSRLKRAVKARNRS